MGRCSVCLLHGGWSVPFFHFLLVILRVQESALRRMARSLFLGNCVPYLKNPMSHTLNCFLLVADFVIPFLVTVLGFVYSPTLST